MKTLATPRRRAFTLVEILVVLAIIGILAALLFPAFARAQENARQTNCASNLHQIGLAVQQYYQDTRRYPDSLVDLLPDDAEYDTSTTSDTAPQGVTPTKGTITRGTGYLKGGVDILMCPNDDLTDRPKSSYGALTKAPQPPYDTNGQVGLPNTADAGRYVFNWYGYRTDGFILSSPAGVVKANPGSGSPVTYPLLRNPAVAYNVDTNPMRYSLSNKFAPASTIITHCVYHRPNTANDVPLPADLYKTPTPQDGNNARDIVLRLDGSTKAVDVSTWNAATPSPWQIQR